MNDAGKWTLLFMVSFLAFYVFGCAVGHEGKGAVTTLDKAIPVVADNEQIQEFNTQLGGIEDQASAEKAVNTFVGYMDSRIKKEDGPSAQSLGALLGADLIEKIAQDEVAARKGESVVLSIASADGMDITAEVLLEMGPPLVDVGMVTDNLNELAEEEGIWISDDTVETAKAVVEESIPNLNPEGDSQMTPMGAVVLGYAIASEDDGSAAEGSVDLPRDKVSTYIETVTQ